MKQKNRALSFAVIVFTAIAGFTCKQNIGLGGRIDILPPSGGISYPDAGETPIRGSFVLKGTANDDDGIQSISVVFENIETKERSRVYEASGFSVGSASASWVINVENESTGREGAPHELVKIYPLADGEYTAIVSVSDNGGKTSTFTKNYKIDNTPPVFIVSRPSTVVDAADTVIQQADGYGAVFSVVGQAGERNTVEKLDVHVPGIEPIKTMFVGNNINAQIAVYSKAPPSNPLYDLQEQDKTKPIRGKLYLYDNAREYKGGGGASSGEGNKADWYYLWDSIYTTVIAKGYTPEVISDYFAGKKGSDKNDHDKKIKELRSDEAALNKLKSAMIKMEEKRSTFKLDPSISPGFKVIGVKNLAKNSLNLVQASSLLFKAGSETAFSVELIRNKDNIPLVGGADLTAYKASNIEIVLLKWNGNGSAEDSFKTGSNLIEKSLLRFSDLTDTSGITVEGGNLRIKCLFPTTEGEGYYAVQVKGTDTSNDASHNFEAYDNSNSVNGGMYIINFLAVGTGPRIRPIRPQGYQKDNFEIFADITGIDASGTVYYNIGAPVDTANPDVTKVLTKADTANPSDPKYKATINISGLTDGDHEIHFLVKSGSGASDADKTVFTVDKAAPQVKISSPDLSRNQSGDFTMRGSVKDVPSDVKSIKYIVGKQSSNDITVKPVEMSSDWKPLVLSGDSWAIGFTDADNITQKTKAQALGKKVEGLAAGVELYDIPVFFLVEDKAGESTQKGNTAIITKTIRVDPNGDIPEVTVLSPEANKVLGGTIRISGTVSVPDPAAGQVGSVWIQITDKKDGGGNPDFTQSATFGTTDWCPSPDGKELTSYTAGTPYWSVEINKDKEFKPSSGTQRAIWFRLRGKNNRSTPVAGQWTAPIKIVVDTAAPTITGMKVATNGNINTPIPSGQLKPDNRTYVSNMWIKGDDLYLCADLAHDAGIETIDISGTYVGSSSVSLTGDSEITGHKTDTKQWFVQNGNSYKMQIPLKTTTNPGSNNGFTINVTIKAKKQGDVEGLTVSASFSFKYDNSVPTAVFGTKIASSGTVTVSGTSFTDPALIGKTNITTAMKVFASGQDINITAFDKDAGKVTLDSAPANPTKGYLIYAPIEYLRPDLSGKVGVFGAAYDVGAGVEKVKVQYNNSTATEIVFPSGVITDVGNGDVNFVTWKGEINVNGLIDGIGKIVITPIDRANNEHAPIEVPVKLKKNSLTISSVELGTDLNRNETIANAGSTVETKTLALTYDAANPNGIDSTKYDWHGKADAGEFRFKNDKSQIKIVTGGGSGTKKYTLKRKKINDLLPEVEVHNLSSLPSNGIIELKQTDFDKIKQSDDLASSNPTKRTLVLTVWDSAQGLTSGTDTWKAELTFDVIVDTKDRIAPTNTINPFKWVSESENSLYENSRNNGHIEIGTGLPSDFTDGGTKLMDRDDKVSGKISLTGTVHDDQVITEIWAKIDDFTFTGGIPGSGTDTGYTKVAAFESGSFSPPSGDFKNNGWHFSVVANNFSVEDGHTVTWQLDWNTAEITGGVRLNTNIAITVKDTDKINTVEKTRKVDVVPYITGVETSIKTLLGKDFMRSATGAYTVRAKTTASEYETVTVTGFNLKVATLSGNDSDIRLSKSKTALEGTTKKGTGLTASQVTAGDNSKWKVTIKSTGNGYLTFIVNGVPSINNIDNNDAEYNKEASVIQANADNDCKIELWDFTQLWKNTNAQYAKNAVYPSMVMKGNTPQFAYVNNAEGYGLAEFWDGNTEIKIYENWDLFTFSALALNSDDSRAALFDINVVQQGNGNPSDSGGIMTNFFYNPPNTTWSDTTYFFRDYNVWIDGLYKSGVKAVLDRYQYPCIKMVGNNSLSHVFYSTYDALEDRIIFRYFKVGTDQTHVGNNNVSDAHVINEASATNQLYINKEELNQVVHNSTNWPVYGNSSSNNKRFDTNGNYSGTTKQPQAFSVGANNGLYSAAAGVPRTDAGNIVTDARGILVYYSGTSLNYIYATNKENTAWSTPVVLDTDCGGGYVNMVVDKDKHVHIAYQDSFGGDVKYIYIPDYKTPSTRKLVKVDSYLTVGGRLTLTVHDKTPYIAYKGLGNTAKVAWYKANNGIPTVASLTDGVDADDKFNGTWEAQVIPTRIVDSDTNRFNIGVGTDGRPVIGYSNNHSGNKGIEYLTRMPDLTD